MAATSALSETLKSITITKIKELEKQRSTFNTRRHNILAAADAIGPGVSIEKLAELHRGVKAICHSTGSDNELDNIGHWLDQACHDPAVSRAKLESIDTYLRGKLDVGNRKLDLAHLYSRLLTEWIETPAPTDGDADDLERSDSDESFEVVEDRQKAGLEQLRDKFARVVFEPLQTDEVEIDNYLGSLFPGDHGAKALKDLRDHVGARGENTMTKSFTIDEQSLRWCIKALLKNQLLNDEKKASLNDFLKDESVLKEIQDVLNMRLRDLKEWQWDLGEDGMPVVPRQSLNGKWRVMMDEDVMQALLTHFIGTSWAVQVKGALRRTRFHRKLWKQFTRLGDEDHAKRRYWLGEWTLNGRVAEDRLDVYTGVFFMSTLPNKFFEEAGGYDDEDEAKTDDDKKSPKDVKQLLLRTLATEALLRRSIDGEVAVVQSDFKWFATGIAHSTVFAVMRFAGFQEEWITFFKKVLEPPLNMLDDGLVRTRKRGLPMAHVFEKLLGELVLFFMDLAVAQNDGMILYRFHDDLYLAGKPKQVADSWKTMEMFAKVMGLEFNEHKTGSVYLSSESRPKDASISAALPKGEVAINFLQVDSKSGKWEINQEHVREHVTQLKKQLDDSKSVLQWIKTWNSCIGRFFGYTFGEPAHCFGTAHIDAILATHNAMQRQLFPNTTVIEHVKSMIMSHFPSTPTPIPDTFITMPESLGGLGLKNPFISLLMLRQGMLNDKHVKGPGVDSTPTSPEDLLQQYLVADRERYATAKKSFDNLTERERRRRYKASFPDDEYPDTEPPLSWSAAQKFLTYEDYIADREKTCPHLYSLYKHLLSQPKADGVSATPALKQALERLAYKPEGLDLKGKEVDQEILWTVQAHEEELVKLFGSLEVVDRGVLPVGVLGALKARRVTWQMVL